MTKEQRTAMARVISDMIKADNIIEESEIKDMKKLMSEYAITHQEMSDARKIRFTDAVKTLKDLPMKERQAFSTILIVLLSVMIYVFLVRPC